MKNLTPFLLCFLLFNFMDANGQAHKGIGIMAGANISRIQVSNAQVSFFGGTIDLNDDFGWQPGAQIGITATPVVFNEQFSLNTGLAYFQRGATTKALDPSALGTQEGLMRLQYLSIPVLARFYPTPMLFLEAGPQVAYLLDARSKLKGGSESFDLKRTVDNDLDLGLLAGLGVNLHERLSVSLQYYHGLSKVADFQFTDANGEAVGNQSWRNRSLQLGLAVEAWQ